MTTHPASTTHPFSHIAPGPYRFCGNQSTEDRVALNSRLRSEGEPYTTNMCGGTCRHCGTEIWDVYYFKAADGTKFKVGCECAKLAAEDLDYREAAKFDAARRKVARVKRHRRELARIEKGRELMASRSADLAAHPHPRGRKGETLLDWAEWMFENAGNAGKIKVCRAIEKALA